MHAHSHQLCRSASMRAIAIIRGMTASQSHEYAPRPQPSSQPTTSASAVPTSFHCHYCSRRGAAAAKADMPCACCGVWVAKPTWLPCTAGDSGLFSWASGSLRVSQSTGQLLRCFCEVCVLQRAATANLAAARCLFKPDVAEGVEHHVLHRVHSLVQELSGTAPATLPPQALDIGSSSSGPCSAKADARRQH